MNLVVELGRLTRDPEVKNAGSTMVGRYRIAVDREYAKKDDAQQADFFDCVVFGKNAETAEKYLRKGSRVLVTGHLQSGSYTNREGKKVYTVEIVVDKQKFVDSKGAGSASDVSVSAPAPAPAPAPAAAAAPQDNMSGDGFMNIPEGWEDTVPFE